MAMEHNIWQFIRFFFLILPIITISSSDSKFLAEIFANECVVETWYVFPGDNKPSPKDPYVLISMCHALPAYSEITNYTDEVKVKPIAHYSPHKFRIHFVNIKTTEQITIWQNIYERLIITSIQRRHFKEKAKRHINDYNHYTANEFKLEFLRSRWNLDEISLHESVTAHFLLLFTEDQFPYSIERTKHRHNNISDFFNNDGKLFYRVVSGRGHTCKHETQLTKLKSLTKNFNAYDRIFCDAFEYYNIPHEGYWNSDDIFYLRGRFVRDDILSSFPPDSKAVYYASPMITFVVLQRESETWMFIFRPFPRSLWGLIIIALFALKGTIYLMKVACKTNVEDFKAKILIIRSRHMNAIEFTNGLYRIVIMSTYSGMILLGILYPVYFWVPDTFTGLNYTTNYKVCTSRHAPIKNSYLIDKFKLNAVSEGMWEVRSEDTPANYLANQIELENWGNKPRNESDNVTSTDKEFYAALMYDDKVNLWLKGREFLPITHSFFDRIKPANDKVLSEMRYVSVAAGATRLHFVLEAIRWGFTCGVWMRYHYLELNYYENVAPLIVKRLNMEKAVRENKALLLDRESNNRPLTTKDLYSSFVLNAIGLAASYILLILEFCHFKFLNYKL